MKTSQLNEMSVEQLRQEILQKSQELFKIRLRCRAGVEQKTHLIKVLRRTIARIQTVLTQKQKVNPNVE